MLDANPIVFALRPSLGHQAATELRLGGAAHDGLGKRSRRGAELPPFVFEHGAVRFEPLSAVSTDHKVNVIRVCVSFQLSQVGQKVTPIPTGEDLRGLVFHSRSHRRFAQEEVELLVDEHGVAIRQVRGNELYVIGGTSVGTLLTKARPPGQASIE